MDTNGRALDRLCFVESQQILHSLTSGERENTKVERLGMGLNSREDSEDGDIARSPIVFQHEQFSKRDGLGSCYPTQKY
jgi:hypothetical protein